MKINELENKLRELEYPKAPEKVNLDVLSFAETQSKERRNAFHDNKNRKNIPILDKFLLSIVGSIPFIEIFWLFNEVFVKKNKIKLHL
ncbi:MAG: hypothetical protein GQ534_09245 [Candidatus Delongbacteria bacterium]|nr:hypothetical protein [Candidatus Delongbacteria bacterium]